jgi:hypothetical protein
MFQCEAKSCLNLVFFSASTVQCFESINYRELSVPYEKDYKVLEDCTRLKISHDLNMAINCWFHLQDPYKVSSEYKKGRAYV